MTAKTDWVLYGITDLTTSQKYMGIYHRDDDNYITSSTNLHLKESIKNNNIERVILARGNKEEVYNQEYYFLSKYDAKNNPKFFNKSNGGGPGIKKTYRPSKKHENAIMKWVDHNVWSDPNSTLTAEINKLGSKPMVALWEDIKQSIAKKEIGGTKEYPIEEISVENLSVIAHNQSRSIKLIDKKLTGLTAAFKNPGLARTRVTPVIVIVKNGKNILLVDGNHRVNAARIAGWDTFPTIKIDHSEFNGDQYLINFFGQLMNHNEVEVTGNDMDDLVKSLRELHTRFPDYEINCENFISIAKDECGGKNSKRAGRYLNADVIRKCHDLAKIDKELLARNNSEQNFIDHTKARLSIIWYQSTFRKNKHQNTIFQTLDGIKNGGLGGAISYAVENLMKNGVNEANLVIHFKSLDGYLTEARDIVEELRIILEHGVTSKINIYFVDPFKERIVETMDEIGK